MVPSILKPSCSYSQMETGEFCCKRRKMKLMGGSRTLPRPPPPSRLFIVELFVSGYEVRKNNIIYSSYDL